MASASTAARILLSRSFAAARQALVQRTPVPRPVVRASVPRVVRAQPRSTVASTRWHSSSSSSSSSNPPSPSASQSSSSSASPSEPSTPTDSHALGAPEAEAEGGSTGKQPIGRVEPRLSLTFTCQAGPEKEQDVCGHRSSHEFSRKSYEKGVVIIQCPECKARHLIADHLGWFNVIWKDVEDSGDSREATANAQEVTGDGQHKTVEELVKAKGEKVTRGRVNFDGDIEYAPE